MAVTSPLSLTKLEVGQSSKETIFNQAIERLDDTATETATGFIELATQAEVNTGTDAVRAVTPATLNGATSVVHPARTITTNAPLTGGGDLSANRTLDITLATESADGSIELATQAETDTGTDDARAITPLKLKTNLTTPPPIGATTPNTGRFSELRATVVATASLPAAGAGQDGRLVIEDAGAGTLNLVIYGAGVRFRITGTAF